MKNLNLIILLVSLFFSSCKEKEWVGKQILFPDKLIFTRYVSDTTDYQIPESEYKILIYVDSVGCTGCRLQLHKWKDLMVYTDSATTGKVPFLFFFHPKDLIEIKYLLKSYEIDRPVCIDLDDQLNKLNHFPTDTTFQTFLLDKKNKVIATGNPIHDTTVKDLYLKLLTGKDNPTKKMLNTTAEALETEIDFGTFDRTETKEATIEVKNTGDNPLVIVDISTTCGCTVATYDKRPAKPGESLRVGIKMTPKDTGFFDEVVTIKYNSLNNEHVKLKIKGNVR